jgi:mono/diheme cytochrome c family protein
VRATSLAAGGLACAGAAMTIAAFAGGGEALPKPTPAHAGATDRGAQVFIEQGCGSCHTFAPANAHGGIGPDLALSLNGRTRAYVLQSIVAPNAEVAQGWSPDTMPGDYGERIAPNDLVPLADYLLKGAG